MSILQKNKKAAAGIGVAAAAAAVLALGAGTYAAFTDTENTQATFAAGSLDLQIGSDGTAGVVNLTGLVPGQTVTKDISVANVGNVNGLLSFTAELAEEGGPCPEPEVEVDACGPDLANAITVSVEGYNVKLSQLPSGNIGPFQLAAGADDTYTLTFTVSDTASNEIMGDSATVDIVATLDQQD